MSPRLLIAASAVLLGGLLAGTCWFAGIAHASTDATQLHHRRLGVQGSHWFVKGQDLAGYVNAGQVSTGLTAQAQADGFALPQFQHIGCGQWTTPGGTVMNFLTVGQHLGRFSQAAALRAAITLGASDDTSCNTWGAQATPLFENLASLEAAVSTPGWPYTTAMYDIESWVFSDPDNQDPVTSIRQACAFAAAHGISLIVSPGGALNTENNVTAAIQAGAAVVSIQSQSFGTANFDTRLDSYFLSADVARLDYGTSTQIWFGLGTNTATPNNGETLYDEYQYAQTLGLSNAWLNANNWGAKNQCDASMGGPGCPQYAMWFFHDLGVVPTP